MKRILTISMFVLLSGILFSCGSKNSTSSSVSSSPATTAPTPVATNTLKTSFSDTCLNDIANHIKTNKFASFWDFSDYSEFDIEYESAVYLPEVTENCYLNDFLCIEKNGYSVSSSNEDIKTVTQNSRYTELFQLLNRATKCDGDGLNPIRTVYEGDKIVHQFNLTFPREANPVYTTKINNDGSYYQYHVTKVY